jgi:LmbE family N-acetylglucosaminyl deacetylase
LKKKHEAVLVIAPHMDDEVLGCGGAIGQHVANGDDVYICFVANRIYDHTFDQERSQLQEQHAEKARRVLGYKNKRFLRLMDERLDSCLQDSIIPIEDYTREINPDIVYSPFPFDNNQDHRAVAQAVQVVLRPCGSIQPRRWLYYEVPSSTEQAPHVGNPVFRPTVYLEIDSWIEKKIEALHQYTDECRPFPNPRSPESLKALAIKRGMEVGLKMAEAFMLVRERV